MANKNFELALILTAVLNAGCSVVGIRSEETPKYEVVMKDGDKEIRSYSSYIVAKTTVAGEYKEAQGEAFRILAGYIFGKNKSNSKIAMTAPVTHESDAGQKIAMTAPVTQSGSQQGWVMTFMMPSQYKMEDLPEPLDKRIEFAVVPPKKVGAIRYAWFQNEERNMKKGKELLAWLETKPEYSAASEPYFAGYDPPWTLPFFRRNEMLVELK